MAGILAFSDQGRGQVDQQSISAAAARARQIRAERLMHAGVGAPRKANPGGNRESGLRPSVVFSGFNGGDIFSVAGQIGQSGYLGDDVPASQTTLSGPAGVALDAAGNIYIADTQDNLIRKVAPATASNPTPNIELLAGSLPPGTASDQLAYSCGANLFNGTLTQPGCNLNGYPATSSDYTQSAYLTVPSDVKVDAAGDIYILDSGDQVVTVVYEGGAGLKTVLARIGIASPVVGYMYTLAGTLDTPTVAPPTIASAGDGGAAVANGGLPQFDGGGNLLPSATFGGQTYISSGESFAAGPVAMALDTAGNIYVTDTTNNTVRVIYEADPMPPVLAAIPGITPVKGDTYTIAGTYAINDPNLGGDGFNDCSALQATTLCGEGLLATSANLSFPTGVAVDGQGNVYIVDQFDNVVRVIYVQGTIQGLPASPVAGHLYTIAGDPSGLGQTITDAAGNIVAANLCLPSSSNCGEGTAATTAQLNNPSSVALDQSGNIYISDSLNQVVRAVFVSGTLPNVANPIVGHLYTVAGTISGAGFADYATAPNGCVTLPCGDGGIATSAQLLNATGLVVDSANNLFIADTGDNVIRQVVGIPPGQPQTISFSAISDRTYSATAIPLDATASSGLPITYTTTGPVRISNSTAIMTGAGPVTITANQAGGEIGGTPYNPATPVAVSFTIGKATLTFTAGDTSVGQGSPAPDLSDDFTPAGYVGRDNATSFTGTPTLTTTYAPSAPLFATFPIVIVQGSLASANYTFTFVNGTLTVQGTTPQTINFPPIPTQVYGSSFTPAAAATPGTGRVVKFRSSDSTLATVSASGTVVTLIGVGNLTLTAKQSGDGTYAPAQPVSRPLAVTQAPLMVSANNVSVVQGHAIPALTYSVTGFVNQDTQADATTGAPTLTAGTKSTATLGTYPITVTAGTFAAPNYNPAFVDGTLTVVAGQPQTINFAPPPTSVVYGAGPIPLTATSSSGLPVSLTVTGTGSLSGSSISVARVGIITVTASQGGDDVYAAATPVSYRIFVAPAALTVTASSYTLPIATDVPILGYAIAGFLNGDTNSVITGFPLLSTTDQGSNSPQGIYPISVDVGGMSSTNYTFVPVGGTITVLPGPPPTYTLTASPSSITMGPGQVRQATILVVPVNGYVNKYNSKTGTGGISFSCGSLPTNVTCSFSPAVVSVAGSKVLGSVPEGDGQLTTITINAGAASAALRMPQGPNSQIVPAALFFLPGSLGAAFLAFNRRRFAKAARARAGLALLFLLAGIMGMGACGYANTQNTSSFAKPGTSTIVINAVGAPSTSSPTGPTDALPQALNLTVTIQ